LTDEPFFPGCLVDCVLIGVIEAEQEEDGETKRNDRLIALAHPSVLYSELKGLADLNPVVLKQIEAFFVNYQKVRYVKMNTSGRHGSAIGPHKIIAIVSFVRNTSDLAPTRTDPVLRCVQAGCTRQTAPDKAVHVSTPEP
jgi:hypothetical protein